MVEYSTVPGRRRVSSRTVQRARDTLESSRAVTKIGKQRALRQEGLLNKSATTGEQTKLKTTRKGRRLRRTAAAAIGRGARRDQVKAAGTRARTKGGQTRAIIAAARVAGPAKR